jgi:ribosomal protein L29
MSLPKKTIFLKEDESGVLVARHPSGPFVKNLASSSGEDADKTKTLKRDRLDIQQMTASEIRLYLDVWRKELVNLMNKESIANPVDNDYIVQLHQNIAEARERLIELAPDQVLSEELESM